MNKYSFLLPAYKAKYFRETLISLKNQTFRDFKVVVSDDCSFENLSDIFKEIVGDDSRFLFRRNKINLGSKSLVSHWNLLLDLCDTEYFILASDDDVYEKNFLEEINKLVEKYPEIDLIHARARVINENNDPCIEDAIYAEYVSQIKFLTQYEYYNHIECIANYVFKTKTLKQVGGFIDFPLAWNSDTATTALLAKNGVANTKDILFNFRMSGYNISSLNKDNKNITKKKYQAMLCYDNFMDKFFGSMETCKSLLQENEKKKIMEFNKKRIINVTCYYSSCLSLYEFLKFVRFFKKKRYINNIDIYVLFKKWMYERFS